VAATAAALRARLEGARLRAVHLEYEARRVRLHFREATVVWLLHPEERGLQVLGPSEPAPDARPLASTLRSVHAPPDDRLLVCSLRRVRGSPPTAGVVIELMPNQENALVTEGEEATVRHLLRTRVGGRPLGVGRPWTPPPPSTREGADGDLEPARWLEVLEAVPPERRRGVLLSTFAWTSSVNAPALLGEGRDGLVEGLRLWRRIRDVALGRAPLEPALLDDNGQPYPLTLPGRPARPVPDLLEAFQEAAAGHAAAVGAHLPSALLGRLEGQVERARARLGSLEKEQNGLPDADRLRSTGDLVLARFAQVRAGATEVTLPGFEGEPVTVVLDPALSPHDNARRYYDRAARAERAAERLPALVVEARAAWRDLADLLERARRGEATSDEVLAALPEQAEGGGDDGPSLPYRLYRSSGGLEIRVGRGARRNDDLTFHHSAPDDVWLHARHAAGAHVILRWREEGNPPARDLAEAAVLAALSSKARTSGSVPVDWTRRKYVRKPRRAPPGTVVPERVQTLFVEPDPSMETRLRTE
jgi:predicted ribosome quality control (RQC) complex YloA/Tae2 family protein